MTKRYGTLDVSLNMSGSTVNKAHKTIEAFTERDDEESSKAENDEKYTNSQLESINSKNCTTRMKN